MTTLDLYEKVAFARTLLSRKFPYLTPLLYGMQLIEDMQASSNFSVSSDEAGNIHWNPKAFDHMPQHMSPSPCMMTRVPEGVILTPPVNVLRDAEGKVQTAPITVGEMAGVLLHEYLHVVYEHIHRGREINAKPFHWNLAADISVNRLLVESDIPCIPGHVAYQTLLPEYQRRIRLDSASVPAIYDVIKDCPLLQNQSCTMCGGSKQHSSSPETEPGTLPSEDSSPSSPLPTQENEYSYTNLDNKVEQVLDQMEAHPGTLPGVLKALLKGRAPKGVVPWQDILRARLSQAVTMIRGGGHRTYQKPSRRHDSSDLIRPRYLSPKQVLLAVIDTSGSVSNEQLKTFWEEISLASQHTSGFWLMECDVRIQSTRWMRPGEPIPEIGAGRGGTSFAAPFEALPTLNPRPTVVTYLTDGEGYAPEVPPSNLTTFWVIDNPIHHDLPMFIGERFGEVIRCQNKR